MAPKRKKPASSSPRKAPARRHATTSIQEDTTSAGNARPIPPPAIPHVDEVSFPPPPQPYPPPLYYGAPTGAHGHYGYMIPPPAMHPPPHVQPSALGPAPTGFVHQPSSEFVRQAAKHVSGHAPPPFSPEPPEAAPVPVKKGKRPSYTDEHLTVLVDCVAQVRPMGPDAWARVEKLFNFHCNQLDWPPRTGTALREQWNKMVKLTKPPTGEGEFPPHIARAQALAKSIADEAGVAHVNDSAGMSGTNARYRHWLPKTPPRAPRGAARQCGHSPGNAIEVSSSDSEVEIIAVKPATVKRQVKSEPVAIKQEATPVTVKREVKREPDVSIKSRSSSYRAGQSSSGIARSTAVTSAPVARVGPSSPRRGRANRDEMLQQLVMSTGPQGQLVKSVLTSQEGNIRALEMGNQRKSARIDQLTDKLAEEARRADRAEAENRVMKLLLQRGFSGAARDLLADIDIGFPVLDRHQAGSSSGTRSYHLSQSPSRSRLHRPPLSSPRRTLPSPSPRRRHALSPSPSSRRRSARTHQTPSPTQTRSSSRPITWSPSPQRGVMPSPAFSRNHHTPSSPIPHDLSLPPESHAASRSRPLGLDALALAASEVAAAGNDGLPETPSSPLDYV